MDEEKKNIKIEYTVGFTDNGLQIVFKEPVELKDFTLGFDVVLGIVQEYIIMTGKLIKAWLDAINTSNDNTPRIVITDKMPRGDN